MKLIELVNYFRNGGTYEEFRESNNLDAESEVVEIYMEKPYDLDNNLAFFEIEKTEGKREYVFDNKEYANLFDFYYFLDAIEESKSTKYKFMTDADLTRKLYDYAINDA